jgi:hypothetical protein
MSKFLPVAATTPTTCPSCAYLLACGGLEQQSLFGCFSACGSCREGGRNCDYTCPSKPGFLQDFAEIGGFHPQQRRELPGPSEELPTYVPLIRHGYRRDTPLPLPMVGLNTFEVLDMKCASRELSPEDLRHRFRVSSDARMLLISVAQDRYVESFWEHRTVAKLRILNELGVAAITTPNFSFFDDAPRLHSIRNFWRIVRSAEDLADAGLSPIVHVNALSREDWKQWAEMLRKNPAIRYVCKEFQTGLRDSRRATEALDGLRGLQQSVGRALHPVIVGGRRVVSRVAASFDHFTVADSVPFMATVNRKRITWTGTAIIEEDQPTEPEESLDELLQANVRAYTRLVRRCAGGSVAVPDSLDEGVSEMPDEVHAESLFRHEQRAAEGRQCGLRLGLTP